MPVGFQALTAVTVNHWTQFSSDLETDPAAKAARVMDFHASSFGFGFFVEPTSSHPLTCQQEGILL